MHGGHTRGYWSTVWRARSFGCLAATAIVFGAISARVKPESIAAGTADEIHYAFGDTSDSLVINWRGEPDVLEIGLEGGTTVNYTATVPSIVPTDDVGPFREVTVTGLLTDSTYAYRIGDGPWNSLRTQPTDNYTWVDVGDTGSTMCSPWVADTHALIAAQSPSFVTHGGDISYANECGEPAVHQYYVDQEAWSHSAAMQPVWGNHEYRVASGATDETPQDSLLNHKGRNFITHAQTVPSDTATTNDTPGCGTDGVNSCLGEDWGWFRAGAVLYISYPEPWPGAVLDWNVRAGALMQAAQDDPTVQFIVTYGHRPAYSSVTDTVDPEVRDALQALAQQFSPSAARPNGKYVLNVAHHAHGAEVFAPIDGLVHITNGGGGAGIASTSGTPADGSLFRTRHPSILRTTVDRTAGALTVSVLCGPVYDASPKEPCTYATELYNVTFRVPTVADPTINPPTEVAPIGGPASAYGVARRMPPLRTTSAPVLVEPSRVRGDNGPDVSRTIDARPMPVENIDASSAAPYDTTRHQMDSRNWACGPEPANRSQYFVCGGVSAPMTLRSRSAAGQGVMSDCYGAVKELSTAT
jgi:hypothetical protein